MALQINHTIDEEEIAHAIRTGELQLAHILQFALTDEGMTNRLIEDIEHLGGTHDAGQQAARFAAAMQES